MSVLLDDDTIVLEQLEFQPPCCYPTRDTHAAQLSIRCRTCNRSALICEPHLTAERARIDAAALVMCLGCRARAATLDDLVEVLPL